MNKRLTWAAVFTLIGFPLIGWVILYIFGKDPLMLWNQSLWSVAWYWQAAIGLILGVILGKSAQYIVTRPFLKETERKYSNLIRKLKLTHAQIIFISFCAGFGEELLFRGSIQPLLGIWVTALLFVAIHGYLNPTNWKISVYGLFMTVAIALLGYCTVYLGILTACVAHMMIDVVLFYHLTKAKSKFEPIEEIRYEN